MIAHYEQQYLPDYPDHGIFSGPELGEAKPVSPRKAEPEPVPVLLEWRPYEGAVPKGLFLASIRYRADDNSIKHTTKVLVGQLNRAYDQKTGNRVKFGSGSSQTLTHYMPLPDPVQ